MRNIPVFYLYVVALASLFYAEAAPLARRHRQLLTRPLTRLHHRRDDVHPRIYMQQHVNRGLRRFARMTGSEGPSDEELTQNLRKRMVDVAKSNADINGISEITNSNSTTEGNPGVSQAEIDQLVDNGVTVGKTPSIANSAALDILGNDVGYATEVEIGTPPRTFLLIVDSGSADLWVPLDTCVSEDGGSCGNHTFISEEFSSSLNLTQEPWSIVYGSGSASGLKVSDNVAVAGITLNRHQFGVANNESVEFSSDSTQSDGLMGLALSTLSQQGFPTPVEAMASLGFINEAITSYKLSRVADGLNDGEVTFGGLDETKFDANTLVTMDNLDDGFWVAQMTSASVDNNDLGINRSVILDTGTTLLIMPSDDAKAVHSQIDGASEDGSGTFFVPCNTNASVALTFGGASFEIAPQDLAFVPVRLDDPTGLCVSGITAGDIGDGSTWLAGDTFLKSVYFSTNVNKKQISLAKLT